MTMNGYRVRLATQSDCKKLKQYFRSVQQDVEQYAGIPVKERLLHSTVSCAISSPDAQVNIVLNQDNQIRGCMLSAANQMWFSAKKEVVDLFFYVSPDARGMGQLLLRRHVQWARDKKAVKIFLGTSTGENSERVGRLYKAFGATLLGNNYCINLMEESDEQQSA